MDFKEYLKIFEANTNLDTKLEPDTAIDQKIRVFQAAERFNVSADTVVEALQKMFPKNASQINAKTPMHQAVYERLAKIFQKTYQVVDIYRKLGVTLPALIGILQKSSNDKITPNSPVSQEQFDRLMKIFHGDRTPNLNINWQG